MGNIFFDRNQLKSCGKNVIIGKTVRIRKPHLVSIGDNVIIDDFTYIPCAMEIGSYTHIGANNSFIGGQGFVKIGSFVNIAPGCQIVTGTNDYWGGGLVGPAIPDEFLGDAIIEPVEIGDFSLIACQTVILEGTKIPEGMATGAMSLIKKGEYKPWTVYAGVPCKEKGQRNGSLMKQKSEELLKSEGK